MVSTITARMVASDESTGMPSLPTISSGVVGTGADGGFARSRACVPGGALSFSSCCSASVGGDERP